MKRIDSIRQLKKHLKPPFSRMYPFVVITYTDTFYDGRKGVFVDHSERYYLDGDFKSKTVNVSSKRRETVADDLIEETYTFHNLPSRVITRHRL